MVPLLPRLHRSRAIVRLVGQKASKPWEMNNGSSSIVALKNRHRHMSLLRRFAISTDQTTTVRQGRAEHQRIFSSSTLASSSPSSSSQPPLAVRVALVSSTTALCTPAFPVVGFVNFILRVSIQDPDVRRLASGFSGSILSFACWTLLPAMYQVAPVLVPFAIGNGVVAGLSYGVLDVAAGGPSKLRRNPLVGAGIGIVTAYVAPNYCYGPAFEALYGLQGMTESCQTIMALPLVTQATVATGFVAGLCLHPILRLPMQGISGVHWTYFSGTLLGTSAFGLWYMYTPDESLDVPEGSYAEPRQVLLLDSILRYRVATGTIGSYSVKTGQWLGPPELCREARLLAESIEQYDKPTVDDRLMAWVISSWKQSDLASRYPSHVVSVKNGQEIRLQEKSQLETDATVAFILDRSPSSSELSGNGTISSDAGGSTVQNILRLLEEIDQMQGTKTRQQKQQRKVASIEAISKAVELLMGISMSESKGQQNNMRGMTDEEIMDLTAKLETFIRRRSPGLILFSKEEEHTGESVESQLRQLAWTSSDVEEAMTVYESLEQKERYQQSIMSMVLLSLGGVALWLATNGRT